MFMGNDEFYDEIEEWMAQHAYESKDIFFNDDQEIMAAQPYIEDMWADTYEFIEGLPVSGNVPNNQGVDMIENILYAVSGYFFGVIWVLYCQSNGEYHD